MTQSPTGTSPISHEMFMRYDKAKKAYEWKLTDDSPVIPILESQVPEVISSTKKDVPEMLERSFKSLSEGMASIVPENGGHEWGVIGDLVKKFNAAVLEIKNGGHLECNPAFIQKAVAEVSEIEKIVLATSISLPIKKLFSDSRVLINEVQKQSNIFIVLNALLDAAKKDPKGNWVSASDKPITPGQITIPVGG